MAAAALMGQVRTGVHAHATVGTTPDQVLAGTNQLLTDLGPDLFTSCLYAHLDLARGHATLASAGHPPPLLRLPDGTTRSVDVQPGPLLGILPDTGFPITEVAFPGRDTAPLHGRPHRDARRRPGRVRRTPRPPPGPGRRP
ncbi:hypothetical protein SGLAM104S_09782 [Streptomyces glaucescens]